MSNYDIAEDAESGFTLEAQSLLDQAAEFADGEEYAYHSGAMAVREENVGDFWSIECRNVVKSFGRNNVLNGLEVGIPEGMITIILGPSGTGKSVLIKHLIGLLFPDTGDVVVHGKSVTKMTMSQLLEMRRKFGILFQDGALFGSMNLYDNVAFPLRQHTNNSEKEIHDVVMRRLDEVGLANGAETRMPSELSGGM
ncbi:MAG: transporter ATP-binding protein, partial [Solirubrobacterales bacterium]|nr:transporter ATP-binding protein [Solirubrobacterales bacterium]